MTKITRMAPVIAPLIFLLLLSPPWTQTNFNTNQRTFTLVQASITTDQNHLFFSSIIEDDSDSPSDFIPEDGDRKEGDDGFCIRSPYIPLPKNELERKRRLFIDELLNSFWNPSGGFKTRKGETEEMDEFLAAAYGGEDSAAVEDEDVSIGENRDDTDKPQRGTKPSTYGEVTTIGGRQLFEIMGLYNDTNDDNGGEGGGVVFYDLGSGTGKLVAHAALEVPPPSSARRLMRSVGIELSQTRHEMAVSSWSNLLNSVEIEPAATSAAMGVIEEVEEEITGEKISSIRRDKLNASFIQGSFLDVDISDATHIFVASLCMNSDLLWHLAHKIATSCPNLEVVVTMRPFLERKIGENSSKGRNGGGGDYEKCSNTGSATIDNNDDNDIPVMFRNAIHEVVDIQTTWTKGMGRGQSTHVYYLNR